MWSASTYAYRLKGVRGDSWRIMKVEVSGLRKACHLSKYSLLPVTRNSENSWTEPRNATT